jgi:hypothetical protein
VALTTDEVLKSTIVLVTAVPGGVGVGHYFGDSFALYLRGQQFDPEPWKRIGGLICGTVGLGMWIGLSVGLVVS